MAAAPDSRRHTLRLAGLGVLSVVALGALLWFGYRALLLPSDADLPVVKAPKGHYKVAPEDPGGLNVDHQDVNIYEALVRGRPGAVPETIGPLPEAPRPVVPPPAPAPAPEEAGRTTVPAPMPAPRGGSETAALPPAPPKPPAAREPGAESEVFVQLGAFGTKAAAREAWKALKERHGDLLGRMDAEFPPGDGVVRVHAGPVSTQALAQLVCEQLKARNVDCFIVR